MMDDSKKRFQIGLLGSLGFHLFVFLLIAFAGLFAASHVDDKVVEIAVFGGGGGGGGGGAKPADRQRLMLQRRKLLLYKINSSQQRSSAVPCSKVLNQRKQLKQMT